MTGIKAIPQRGNFHGGIEMYDIEVIKKISEKYNMPIADLFHILGASDIHNLFKRLVKSGIVEEDARLLCRTHYRRFLIDTTSVLLK